MQYNEESFRVPVKSWLPIEEIEEGAMQQLRNAAMHPEAVEHVAVMPDIHVGYGIPVGTVFVTEGSVVPNAVGVDIGCGVAAIPTNLPLDPQHMDQNFWRAWSGQIQRDIPLGFRQHSKPRKLGPLDRSLRARNLQHFIQERATFQLGTLGGGNHFLEAGEDDDGQIWLMVHSGSRHTGLQIADHYHKLAISLKESRGLDTVDDLASLPIDDSTGQDYLHDMTWAAEFAKENRRQMMNVMASALDVELDPDSLIDTPHNLAWVDNGRVIHRKGATLATEGELAVIPGSMATASFIVRGKGNPASFSSCSHGAGRQLGRKAAKRQISQSEFEASLEGTHTRPSIGLIDEAPDAYKDIETVIDLQSDLIEVVTRLRPIITVKGD